MLSLIRDKLETKTHDDILELAWSVMWNVTDETPSNCQRFLDGHGMQYFTECLKVSALHYYRLTHRWIGFIWYFFKSEISNITDKMDMPGVLGPRYYWLNKVHARWTQRKQWLTMRSRREQRHVRYWSKLRFGNLIQINLRNFNATTMKLADKFYHPFSHLFILGNIFLLRRTVSTLWRSKTQNILSPFTN